MPYIKNENRELFDKELEEIGDEIDNVGELNYCITYLCLKYLQKNTVSYKIINDIIGVLECSKLEMYRRVAIPYEDMKIMENGDVYVNCNSRKEGEEK